MWEGDRIFLELMEKGAPFFHLSLSYIGDHLHKAILNGKALAL
jgi:8-oxo-dGTP diphosphatase